MVVFVSVSGMANEPFLWTPSLFRFVDHLSLLFSCKVADDTGSGVAHSNIGLCYGLLGDYPMAAKHHQEALRAALRVQVRSQTRASLPHILEVAVT